MLVGFKKMILSSLALGALSSMPLAFADSDEKVCGSQIRKVPSQSMRYSYDEYTEYYCCGEGNDIATALKNYHLAVQTQLGFKGMGEDVILIPNAQISRSKGKYKACGIDNAFAK